MVGLNQYVKYLEDDSQDMISDYLEQTMAPMREYVGAFWKGYF
jgi:hypothetical protein